MANDPYEEAIASVIEALEKIPLVRGTTAAEYLAALVRAEEEIEDWIETSKQAALDDMRRSNGEVED